MLMHLGIPTPMPRREQHATIAAVVRDVFEVIDHIRDTEQERNAAEAEGPCARGKEIRISDAFIIQLSPGREE